MNQVVIRASTLSGWPDCERRAAARVLRKEIEAAGYKLAPPRRSIGAIVGSAVHFSAKEVLTEKMKGHAASLLFARDAAITSLRTAKDSDEGEVVFTDDVVNFNDAEKSASRMAHQFLTWAAPRIDPIAVEERLEAIQDGVIISGQTDIVAREPGGIVDLKTGARRGNHKPQLGGYSLLNRSHGREIGRVMEVFIKRGTLSKPQPPPVMIEHNLADAETAAVNVIRRIGTTVREFRETKDPWAFMANPSSMLCSPKYCPAHGTEFCREHVSRGQ